MTGKPERTQMTAKHDPVTHPVLSRDDPRVVSHFAADEPTYVPCAGCENVFVLIGEGCCLSDGLCEECAT